ncbi:MAG: hypothetical protein Kow0068_06680 [Marinilabiliales bacterium]
MEYVTEKKVFDIRIKLFTDDFETVLKNKYGIEPNLGKENENPGLAGYFIKYVNEHLQLYIDNKPYDKNDLKFVKKEMNFEATWLFLELKANDNIKRIKIKPTFINDLYADQKNLLIFTYGKVQKGFQFRSYDEFEEIVIK